LSKKHARENGTRRASINEERDRDEGWMEMNEAGREDEMETKGGREGCERWG